MLRILLISAATLAALSPAGLDAQADRSSIAGVRVRVTAPEIDPAPIVGRVLRVEADSLHLVRQGEGGIAVPLSIPLDGIERLEVSDGTNRHFGKGLLIGGGIGLIGLGLIGGEGLRDTDFGYTGGFVLGGAVGLAGGAAVGFLVGGVTRTEKWAHLPPQLWRTSARPGGGFAVALRISF